jgi:hypothetical protein
VLQIEKSISGCKIEDKIYKSQEISNRILEWYISSALRPANKILEEPQGSWDKSAKAKTALWKVSRRG